MKLTTSFLSITFILFIFSATIAAAESGNILIQDLTTKAWSNGLGGAGQTALWTQILYDSANINYVSNFRFKGSSTPFTFGYDYESTGFTITAGGTGTGYAWYDRNTSSVYFTFLASDTFTSSPLTLSYSKNIFSNITINDGGARNGGGVGIGAPVCVSTVAAVCIGYSDYSNVVTGVSATDSYVVSYLPQNYFSIDITKNPSINTKYFIKSATTTYSQESTFNKINIIGAIFNYGNGIYLNTTLATGTYVLTTINTTISGGIGTGTITTDKQNYIIGETPIITWTITTPNPSYSYFLVSTNPINNTHTISSNIATSGTATDSSAFDVSGTWKESIIALNNSCTGPSYYCWIPGDILSAFVSVSSTQPALIANITANKSIYAYHERWNFTVKATGTNQYIIKAFDPNGQLFAGFPSPAVLGNQTLLYTPSAYTLGGTWTAKVYDIVNAQYVAQTTFVINPTQGGYYVGQIHILEGSIDLNTQEYFTVAYTSNGTGTITIKKPDNSTYTTYPAINGSGQDIITLSSSADIGYWSAVLVDSANIYTSMVYVTKGGATTSQNGSFTIFTDKTAYLRGEIVQATYRFPANYNNISVIVYDANGQKMASALRPAPEAQLFGYASITIGQSGTNGNWKITLEDFNKTEYASATFSIGGATTTAPPGSGSTANAAANLFNVFTYMAFYGMVLFLGIFYSAIKLMTAHGAQVNGQALVIIMALVATMEALVGLFDPFKLYIIVITWIFAAIYFRQTRTTATGEQ